MLLASARAALQLCASALLHFLHLVSRSWRKRNARGNVMITVESWVRSAESLPASGKSKKGTESAACRVRGVRAPKCCFKERLSGLQGRVEGEMKSKPEFGGCGPVAPRTFGGCAVAIRRFQPVPKQPKHPIPVHLSHQHHNTGWHSANRQGRTGPAFQSRPGGCSNTPRTGSQ